MFTIFRVSVENFEKILVKPRSLSFFLSLLSPLTLLLCFGHGRAARCALPLPVPSLRPLPAMSASLAHPVDICPVPSPLQHVSSTLRPCSASMARRAAAAEP